MRVLTAVEEVNENQKSVLFGKLMKQFNGDLQGKTVALGGLAFKPETDDMREAPALVLIDKLLKAGCKVRAYDPAAVQECKRRIGDTIYYACDMYDAVLTAIESRSSSPVRTARDENGEATRLKGLYPVGEGAGYAGGIVSAAVDGMRAAERIISRFKPMRG